MEVPVTFDPFVTGLSILLAAGIAGALYLYPAFKRLQAETAHLKASYGKLQSALDRLAEIRAEKQEPAEARIDAMEFWRRNRDQYQSSAAKPVSANEGGQP